jgi:hypothetical protein
MRVLRGLGCGVAAIVMIAGVVSQATAQGHAHTPAVSGLPGGVPLFCGIATITSVASGGWSSPRTWSTGKIPSANDRVAIVAGHTVNYDARSDAPIACIGVSGTLAFRTDADTRLSVVTLMVLEGGALRVGTPATPVAATANAEIVIVDKPFDPTLDPSQLGNGIIGLGEVTMHGAAMPATFLRLAREPLAGDTTLTFEHAVEGWRPGDTLVIPDTRQLRRAESGGNLRLQSEKVRIASVSTTTVTLASALTYDHKGARNASGAIEFLPHAGNLSRNVVVRSERPTGTRGHILFSSRASVDVQYVELRELGRTKLGILNNTETDTEGHVRRIGTNQIGRYALHFHHTFGPLQTPANGYQFTVVGNAIDGSPKWGVVVHRSHYGLIKDNVVYNTRGAGIVTEDGTESFNVFDHNFSLQTTGSRDAAPGNGYSSVLPNPGGDGSAFWFRGPNNYIRNNVAASAAESGFGLPVTSLGDIVVPKNMGAESSRGSEANALDTQRAPVLEFANNEAYGAIQSGVGWAWSGTISGLTVWHAARHGVTANTTATLAIDRVIVRGDSSALGSADENPVGVWIANYAGKEVTVSRVDVDGTRVGVLSPFFYSQGTPADGRGQLTIEQATLKTQIGINVATGYLDEAAGGATKKAVVRGLTFRPPAGGNGSAKPEAISMNYGMAAQDTRPRAPLAVYDFNQQSGRNFSVYYSLAATPGVPCHETLADVGGWVCKVE